MAESTQRPETKEQAVEYFNAIAAIRSSKFGVRQAPKAKAAVRRSLKRRARNTR